METTLLDMAEQQRFVVRFLGALAGRDRVIETDVDDLEARVDAIEKRLRRAEVLTAGRPAG